MKKILCLLLAACMLALWGCIPKQTYTVRFYNGSDTTANVDVTMQAGEKLAVPDSLCDGRTAAGLYRDSMLSDAYTQGTTVSGNMVVFIDWEYAPPVESETIGTEETFAPEVRGSWGHTQIMERDGENLLWFLEVEVPENGKISVYSNNVQVGDTVSINAGAGKYMVYAAMEQATDGSLSLKENIAVGKPDYYVVGTCGNGGGKADAVETNTKYHMILEGSVYVLNVTFTEEEATQDGMVAFQIAYGCCGMAADKHCYGDEEGNSILVPPGVQSISFDPATGNVGLG